MNNQEVVADFRRRWEQSYAWLFMEKQNEEVLIFINRVEDNNDKVASIVCTSNKYGGLVLNLGSEEHELRFKYPPVGVFQCGDDVFLFRRRPARQYRRGICADNSVLWNITRGIVGNRARFNATEVQAAFDHVTYRESSALKLLNGGKFRGVALHNNYAMTLSMDTSKDYILWHWDAPIARMNTEGKVTQILEKSYSVPIGNGEYR